MVQATCQNLQNLNGPTLVSAEARGSFGKIPLADLLWTASQKLSVIQLFLASWASDPYGNRYVKLTHNLGSTAFRAARRLLVQHGFFLFKRETAIVDARVTVCWLVKNLRGARVDSTKDVALKNVAKPATPITATATSENAAVILSDATATSIETITTPIPPQILTQQAIQELSVSSHDINQQQYNGNEFVADKKNEEEEEEGITPQPSRDETRETLTKLREMGMRLNPTLQAMVLKFYSRVPDAIAHIKERVAKGERFKNLEGAFVTAVQKKAKPEQTSASWGVHTENNPPSAEQLAALEQARVSGSIRDYYLSSDNITKVVVDGYTMVPWWEYLNQDKVTEVNCTKLNE